MTLRFDFPVVPGSVPWWLWSADRLRFLPIPIGLGLMTTAYLAAAQSRSLVQRTQSAAARWWLGHGLALVVFVLLTRQVLELSQFTGPTATAWAAAWYGAGLALLMTWLAVLRGDAGGSLLRPRSSVPVVVGGLVFGGACGLSAVATGTWTSLAWATLLVVRFLLGTMTSALVDDPSQFVIGTTTFAVRIAPGCSGYEGVGLIWAFLLVYLTAARRQLRWPQAWWLIPIGTCAIWLANAARITGLILIGSWWSPEVALGGFHSQAGTISFLAVALGLWGLSRWASPFRAATTDDSVATPLATTNPTAAHLTPFLAIVATTMATGALLPSPGFDPLYPLRIVAGTLALVWCRRQVTGPLFGGGLWAIGAGLLVLVIWLILEPAPKGSSTLGSDLTRVGPFGAGVWLIGRVVGSVVVVPLAEEWAFRAYLTRRLIARDFESVPPGAFTWASFLISSLLFGCLHGRWLAGSLAGLIYAGVYYRRGRVGDAALAHALTNAGIAALVLASGDGRYWS